MGVHGTRDNDAGSTTATRKWLGTYNDEMFAFLGILNPSDDKRDRFGFTLTQRTEFVVEFRKHHSPSKPGSLEAWSSDGNRQGQVGPGQKQTFTLQPGTYELRVSMADGTATERNQEHYDVLAKAWIDDESAAKATDLGTLIEETRTLTGVTNYNDDALDFYKLTPDRRTRKMIYTTNALESLHRSLRKIIKTRGSFPSDEAAAKLLFLAIRNAGMRWKRPIDWTDAMGQFAILFEVRFPASAR